MVKLQIVAAGGGDGLQLMVFKDMTETAARGGQGIVEAVVRIVHLIDPEDGLQATFVKAGVVGHQGQAFDPRGDLPPDLRKDRRLVGIRRTQAVDPLAEPAIVLRLRMDEAVERIYDLAAAHDDNAYAAYAARLFVRRFEVYRCKVVHQLGG